MITPSDEDYQQTKRVLQGRESMPESLASLARWVENTYDVPVLNARLEREEMIKDRVRLRVVFEQIQDYEKLMDDIAFWWWR